ncbi:MAG: hypothetical protein AAB434_06050 [Planctomycetota bacterium]
MDKSGTWACVIAGIMMAAGGFLAYDGYSGTIRVDNDGKLTTAKTDLDSGVKKAREMEDRLTKFSSALGYSDLRNWLGREKYFEKWTKEISNDGEVAKKLADYGVDTSKTLSEPEIALAWAIKMQAASDPKSVYQGLLSTDDGIKSELKADVDALYEEFKKKATAEMPAKEQEDLEKLQSETAAKLDAGAKVWSSPEVLQKYLDSWGKTVEQWKGRGDWAPAAATNVKDLLDSLDATIVKLQEKIAAANKARDDARANLHAIIGEIDAEGKPVKAGSMADEEKRKDESLKQLQDEIAALRTKIADRIREGETTMSSLDKEITEETTKLNMMVADKTSRIKELESKLSDTKERYVKLQARQASVVEATEADGQLLFVDLERGIAHLDLGRLHTLFRGTKFEVFRIVKAGKKKTLGEIEILDLGEERSRVAILSVSDPSDPPVAGDFVSNVSFDRNKPKVFSIAGQLKFKYSRDDMRRRLAEWGARVADDVGPSTTMLIVGDRYQEDPNWQRAVDIGTPIMRERELYDALGIE